MISASGNPLDVKGKFRVVLGLGGDQYEAEVVIADIECDLMMGLDFLQTQKCVVDVAKNALRMHDKLIDLNCRGSVGCFRVTAPKDITIPPRSEIITYGQVIDKSKPCSGTFLMEPSDRLKQSGKGLLAKMLVDGSIEVPLRLMNVSETETVLPKGSHIGTLNPVSTVKKSLSPKASENIPEHLRDLYERTIVGMTSKQSSEVFKLLVKYSSVFSRSDEDIGRTGIVRHKIDTGNAHPIKQPLRRNPVHMNPEIDKQIDDMLSKDVIQHSSSPWSSGIVLVTKKDGTKRFCIDYRKLNDVTVKDSYPLPRIDDSLEQLSGAQWFSCLDLNAGYWQVEVAEEDRPKTAFNSRRGLF